MNDDELLIERARRWFRKWREHLAARRDLAAELDALMNTPEGVRAIVTASALEKELEKQQQDQERGWTTSWIQKFRRHGMAEAAVVLVTMLVIAVASYVVGPDVVYRTASTERAVTLPDHTRLDVYPASIVKVRLSGVSRHVELVQGGVRLDVARDPRPFEVIVDHAVLKDIGTRFSVVRDVAYTAVDVAEGKVQITLPSGEERVLPAGYSAVLKGDGANVLPWDAASEAHWRGSMRVRFEGNTLHEITKTLNRYSASMRFDVLGDACRLRPSSASGGMDDPKLWIELFSGYSNLEVIPTSRSVTIRQRGDKSAQPCEPGQ